MPPAALYEYTARLVMLAQEHESSTNALMQQLDQVNTIVDKLSTRATTVSVEKAQLSKANIALAAKVASLETQNAVLLEELAAMRAEMVEMKKRSSSGTGAHSD